MAINLSKGANVNLSRESAGLTKVMVGLGWDPRETVGEEFDLDASALILGSNGKVLSELHFVFYNNEVSPEGAVAHQGDNLTGGGDGDDEQILVDLERVPSEVASITFPVTIHEADVRGQNFGQVRNSFIRIVDQGSGKELVRYDLGEDFATETALVFGELYRAGGEWKFRAVGQGYAGGLAGLLSNFGVNV